MIRRPASDFSVVGWRDASGRSHLSSWDGQAVDAVLFGLRDGEHVIRTWNYTRRDDPGLTFELIPEGVRDPVAYANERGGVFGIGFLKGEP